MWCHFRTIKARTKTARQKKKKTNFFNKYGIYIALRFYFLKWCLNFRYTQRLNTSSEPPWITLEGEAMASWLWILALGKTSCVDVNSWLGLPVPSLKWDTISICPTGGQVWRHCELPGCGNWPNLGVAGPTWVWYAPAAHLLSLPRLHPLSRGCTLSLYLCPCFLNPSSLETSLPGPPFYGHVHHLHV